MIKIQPNKNVLIFSRMRSGTTACVQSVLRDNATLIDFSYGLQVQDHQTKCKVVVLDSEGAPNPKVIEKYQVPCHTDFFSNVFDNITKHNKLHNRFYISKVMIEPDVALNTLEAKKISGDFEKIILWRNPLDVYLSFLAAENNNNFYGKVFNISGTIDVSMYTNELIKIISATNKLAVMYMTNKDKFKLIHYRPDSFGLVDAVHQRTKEYNEKVFINKHTLSLYEPLVLIP